jgi:ParB family transcriptional regulator, chromosome partitioning protein
MTWQPGDLSPEARRAAEAAAEAAGVPLVDWFAQTVRSAIVSELGSLPAEEPLPEAVEPAPEALEPEPAPPAIPSAETARPPPPAQEPKGELDPRILAKQMPLASDYRAQRISPEAQRLVGSGLSGWLAKRIEGLPTGAAPAPPIAAHVGPSPTGSPSAQPKPQLDLFAAAPAPIPTPAPPPSPEPTPPQAIVPLALPTGPLATLPLTALQPARCRARRSGIDAGLPALAASVAVQGVREPILVRRLADDASHYEVVAGERRRLAAERVGRADVPAVVVEADDAEALMLSLAENLGRGDFSPLDEGRAYLRLLTEYRVSPSVLAQRLARERPHIVLALRLLGLPERVRHAIDGGQLAPAQAYALLGAPDPEAMAEQMIQGGAPAPTPQPG